MDFKLYARASKLDEAVVSLGAAQLGEEFTDPYVHQYHFRKYFLEGLFNGVVANLAKQFVEHLRGRKFYKLSPWLELSVLGATMAIGVCQTFDKDVQASLETVHLARFESRHFGNSQYWH